MNDLLLIFAKYPEPGRVKTRLARTIGPERAAALYKEMVETVVRKTAPAEGAYRQILFFDPPEREADFRRWFPGLDLRPQVTGDLGTRMDAAFRRSFKNPPSPPLKKGGEGGFNRAIIIGTDCVDLDRDLIIQAFQKLEESDLVIGPATDGGYYLIGMNAKISPPLKKGGRGDLFTDIPWSTDRVFPMTLERAKAIGLRVELLSTLSDIDEIS